MPKVRTADTKVPADFELVQEKLDEFAQMMREGNVY
jgi:hypothetical protein